jgi:hypothetical protein
MPPFRPPARLASSQLARAPERAARAPEAFDRRRIGRLFNLAVLGCGVGGGSRAFRYFTGMDDQMMTPRRASLERTAGRQIGGCG